METDEVVTPEEITPPIQLRSVQLNLIIDLVTLVPVVAVALLSQSMLLFTDIFDYVKGVTASLIAWHILRRIVRGDVVEYDYGPGKMEALGGLLASLVILGCLLGTAVMAVQRILQPKELSAGFTMLGALVQAVGIGLNGWLWRRNARLAELSRSPLLEAQWRTNRADVISNIGVLVALALTLILRPLAWAIYIDPICALIFIIYASGAFIALLRRSLDDLLDKKLDEELQLKILGHLIDHYEGYETLHGVQSRRSGSTLFVDIGLGFHPDKTVGEVIDAVEQLRLDLTSAIPGIEVNIVLKSPDKNLFFNKKSPIQILPLSPTTLEQAVALVRETFALTAEEKPELELAESVTPGRYTTQLAALGICDPAYWVAFYKGRVIGVTGIYYKPEDRNEAVWGGWTVYDAKSRSAISRAKVMMLKKTIIEAHATGRKFYRLYTSTVPVEAQANRLYDRAGVKVYKTEPMPDGKNMVLYRQAELQTLYESYLAQDQ
jgi:cation diffusion facilitator family transporter